MHISILVHWVNAYKIIPYAYIVYVPYKKQSSLLLHFIPNLDLKIKIKKLKFKRQLICSCCHLPGTSQEQPPKPSLQ